MRLEVKNLNFSYGDKTILKDLSFTVEDGEFISVLGTSGCGKSTLLNVLAGILMPGSGQICIDGMEMHGISNQFAYMPQNDFLFPWRTILDNVCLYGQLARFGLEGCENKYPSELSGGMRHRAAFLRTTLCEANIYLLDEPFGALDVITRGDMQDWLRELGSNLKKTTLLVTHDTDEAIYLSDRILILGAPGEGIQREIRIEQKDRTREWLYRQGALREEIHHVIKNKVTV